MMPPRLHRASQTPAFAAVAGLAIVGLLSFSKDLGAEPLFSAPFYGSDVGLFPKALAVAEFNEDGNPDLVVANIRTTASVLLGRGDGTFLTKRDIAAGWFPSAVATGDLNGDGHQDIIFASQDLVYVALGNGDGTFRDTKSYRAGGSPGSVAVGDLNGDSNLDVVAGDMSSRTLVILLGNGDGTLGPDIHYGSGIYAKALTIADVTGDGHLDLIAADYFSASLSMFQGNGDGSFLAAQKYDVGDSPQSIAIGDLNGDGLSDVTVANSGSSTISLLLGQPDGSFASRIDITTDSWPGSVSLGDTDGDGRLDLVITGGTFSHAAVYLGRGDATFHLAHDFPTVIGPSSQLLADVNNDTRLDLIATDFAHIVAVHLGNGDGSFGRVVPIGSGIVDASWVALGDMNGDGRPDLAAGGYESTTVSFLLGGGDGTFGPGASLDSGEYTSAAALGDLNGDQRLDLVLVGFSHVAVFLANGPGSFGPKATYALNSFPNSAALGDLNRDGRLDIVVVAEGGVTVLPGVGDGSFGSMRQYPAGQHPVSVTINEFNGDGIPDLAVCEGGPYSETGPTNVAILLGLGDWTFGSPREFAIPGACADIASADFNGDGALDIAMADGSNNSFTARAIWVSLGRGDGSFLDPVGFGDAGYVHKILAADLNGDGHVDLAAGASRTIYVFTGKGDGTFDSEGHFGASGSSSMALGDVNLDGRPDIAAPADPFDPKLGVDILLNRPGTSSVLPARVFVRGNTRAIPIGAGGPQLCIYIEPIDGDFEAESVDLSTIVMGIEGTESLVSIPSSAGKLSVLGDINQNGIPEAQACFARTDLAGLFPNVRGKRTLAVSVEGALTSGQRFRGLVDLVVVGTGSLAKSVSVAPNPLNPEGVLSFITTKPGPAELALFDAGGHLVRTLLVAPLLATGPHDVRIDGRGTRGQALASGVYFFRIRSADGVVTGRVTILK